VTPVFSHFIFEVFFRATDTIVGTLDGGPGAWGDFSLKFEQLKSLEIGDTIFAKIVLKHARITPECKRAHNVEHVAPLHGSWKEFDSRGTYIKHLLGLIPAIRSPPQFLYFIF